MKCEFCNEFFESNAENTVSLAIQPTSRIANIELKHLKCPQCHEGFDTSKDVKIFGQYGYHSKCMKCRTCEKSLPNLGVVSQYGVPFCGEHLECYICKNVLATGTGTGAINVKIPLHIADTTFRKAGVGTNFSIHQECNGKWNCRLCKDVLKIEEFKAGKHGICPLKVCGGKCGQPIIPSPSNIKCFFGVVKYIHPRCMERCSCGRGIYPFYKIFPSKWSPQSHKGFSIEIRRALSTFFRLWRLKKLPGDGLKLARDIIYKILGLIATPYQWKTFNGENVNESCHPAMCAINQTSELCMMCKSQIDIFIGKEDTCTDDQCKIYEYQCRCGNLRKYDDDPSESCTKTRCIIDLCGYCNGELLYGKEDNRNLCTIDRCIIYAQQCNHCKYFGAGNLIRRTPINPNEECSLYRCINERCNICDTVLAYDETYEGCLKGKCTFKLGIFEDIKKKIIKFLKKYDYEVIDTGNYDAIRLKVIKLLSELSENEDIAEYKRLNRQFKLWEKFLSKRKKPKK